MTLFKFNSHPAPGYHSDGSLVTTEVKTTGSLRRRSPYAGKRVQANMCPGGGFSGGGAGPGIGSGGSYGMGGTGNSGYSGYGDGSGGAFSSFSGGASAPNIDRYNPVRDRLDEGSVVEDWIPRDAAGLDEMFRLMYHRDHIAGTIVDYISDMIWSEYELTGISDPVIRNIYADSMNAIDVITTVPDLTREFLVIGRSASSLIFDKERGIFKDIIAHDPSFLRITPIPVEGFDPKIDLIPTPAMREFIDSEDPRDLDALKILPQSYIEAIRTASGSNIGAAGFGMTQNFLGGTGHGSQDIGGIPLDPVNTLFLPRRVFKQDYIGTSLFTRLITFWALEKALINATVTSARRRSRPVTHITAGIDNVWEPSAQEMDNISNLFIAADEDPVGAVVTTRTGIDTNEIRSGQDFYKWADEWDLLNEGKLRALGANDALLCLSGDTLIPTKEHGIIRIDSFGDKMVEADFTTVGRNGEDSTRTWLYSGRGQVMRLKTYNGNSVKCTPDHQILVLNDNDLIWKKAKDLRLGDYLCISKDKCTRSSKLELDLFTPKKNKMAHSLLESIIKPKNMDVDLAYLLGLIVSEGTVDQYRVRISNTDLNILEGAKQKLHNVFGSIINVSISEVDNVDRVDKYGVEWRSTKQTYELCCWSKILASYFIQLGVCEAKGRGKISAEKVTPWSILQADENSQLAYLAAYVDGDGSVKRNGKELVFYSYSQDILREIQIILNSHSYDSVVREKSVRTTCGNSYELCKKLSTYGLSSKFENLEEPVNPDRLYGIVTEGIKKLIDKRFVRKVTNVGSVFLNDDGEENTIRKFGKRNVTQWKHLLYRSYDNNEYRDFMNFLKEISPSEYAKLVNLFSKRFKFTQLQSLEVLEEELDVYDIQMSKDPSFTANGLIVHNSGDATYSNQENARMFFMERALNLRASLTRKLFYKRLFPLIARIHGFRKRAKAELDHRIRYTSTADNLGNMPTTPGNNTIQNLENAPTLTQRQALDIPESELITPTIVWKKELVSEIDEAKLDIYERLEEKGVPIHLRDWCSAGNIDLDSQMAGLEIDGDIRKQVNKWKAKYEDVIGSEEEEAKLEFIHNLRNLAHSKVKASVGDETQYLGPLAGYLFWSSKAQLGPLKAKDLAGFLKGINPSDNSYRVVADGVGLRYKLLQFFKHGVKAEIAHYLMFRSGLTPISPVLSEESTSILSQNIKAALDQYATNGNVYQLGKVAEQELKAIINLNNEHRKLMKDRIENKVGIVRKKVDQLEDKKSIKNRMLKDMASNSVKLLSGV